MPTSSKKQFKILLIGDDCLDIYQFGTVDRLSPEAPVPVFKLAHKEERPGMARNVKSNLENLGCDVTYISGSTSVKTRLIDSRSKQHIVRIDNDAASLPIVVAPYYMEEEYDAIVISDYEKGAVTYDLIESLIRDYQIPIFVDTKKTDLARLQGAWVKINQFEYGKIKSECSGLIVTRGADGAVVPSHDINLPAVKVEVADVCGAGDTFLSALTYEYLNCGDIEPAVAFAIKAAAVSVQHLGCYAPRLEEIK